MEELANILKKSLEAHYEDEFTKGWILNALSKLTSCPKFSPSVDIAQLSEKYSRSKICDLNQRANEYKRLTKFKWALKQSSQLVVDPALNFLSGFVQKAIEKGAKTYDSKRTTSSWIAGLALENKEAQNPGINFQAYEKQDRSVKTDEEVQSSLKVKGPQKWTPEGYKEDQPVNKPATMTTNEKITQSIGSATNQVKGKQMSSISGNASGTSGGGR